MAILYVSHRLEEVFELCDRLTIMRNGETIVTKDVADSHIDEVISTMVGREAETSTRSAGRQPPTWLSSSRVSTVAG